MTVSLLLRSSNAIVLNLSSTLIFARHKSLSKYLLTTFKKDSLMQKQQVNIYHWDRHYLPWFFVFSIGVSIDICLWESVLPELNAFLNGFFDFEDMYGCLIAGAGDNVQIGVEHNVLNHCIARSSSQCLQSLPSVCAKNFDHCSTLRSWRYQCTVRIYT